MIKNAMSKRATYFFVAAVFGLSASAVSAGVVNDVPSCYLANHFKVPSARLDQEFFLAIDQTTVFDDRLRAQIVDNSLRSVRPASAYTLLDFSAFSQGRYTEVVTRGVVEARFPEKDRDDVSERALRSFDACMGGQAAFAKKSIVATIASTFTVGLFPRSIHSRSKMAAIRILRTITNVSISLVVRAFW